MNLPIKGFLPITLIDWPGKIASVIFIAGCNFRCPFCHNPELIDNFHKLEDISVEEIFETLKAKKKWLDGVVITGGEPTLYPEVEELIEELKKEDLLVKLDTNGSNPTLIYRLIQKKLLDYIAMDIKGPLSDYKKISGEKVSLEKIKMTAALLLEGKVDYEFRTTAVPDLIGQEEMKKIGQWISGASRYYLQGFRPQKTLDPQFSQKRASSHQELVSLLKVVRPYVKLAEIRGL